ncbi:MAG: FadR family transcriptional regulator [Deltaproteobacteria bacterium]|nr:FadR family transcriptional regulator [Deltaproteobacteria bacterium]
MAATAKRERVVERIAAGLRRSILEGRLHPGDALPSERALAESYAVNRSSVREAMKRLEGWGLIHIRHGGATRVADFFLSVGLDLVPHLVELGVRVDPGILRDLHEIRAMLLGWCAGEAATKADPASIARLNDLARRLSDAKTRPAALQDLDYDFFQELVAITGNRLLQWFANLVREIYSKGRDRFAAIYSREVFDPRHHRQAVAAIRAGNAALATAAMRAHAATALTTLEARP